MGFWWLLEPARGKWAWFMSELRHTYEQDKGGVAKLSESLRVGGDYGRNGIGVFGASCCHGKVKGLTMGWVFVPSWTIHKNTFLWGCPVHFYIELKLVPGDFLKTGIMISLGEWVSVMLIVTVALLALKDANDLYYVHMYMYIDLYDLWLESLFWWLGHESPRTMTRTQTRIQRQNAQYSRFKECSCNIVFNSCYLI